MTFEGQVLYLLTLRNMTVTLQSLKGIVGGRAKLAAGPASMSGRVFLADPDGTFLEVNASFALFHRFGSTQECKRSVADGRRSLTCTHLRVTGCR